jgi:LPPG:FO 2-phospho-L-lactate transferase
MILALAGGVGGAKLAQGLAMVCTPSELTIVVNTGDDFVHLGLAVSPDLDTVMYWLGGINDRQRGWGLAEESWRFMAALERLGGPAWFRLGDSDLATHVERTRLLRSGRTLSQVTDILRQRLGVGVRIAPMTDDDVHTMVHTDEGVLSFQDYFVRRQCEPRVRRLEYAGAANARMSAALDQALADDALDAVVICPSNPLLSIEPILSIPGVRERLKARAAPIVAVSPIVGGEAIKGPAAKILRELGRDSSALEIARHYAGLIDGLVVDRVDAKLAPAIEALNMRVIVTATVMRTPAQQQRLASATLALAAGLNC